MLKLAVFSTQVPAQMIDFLPKVAGAAGGRNKAHILDTIAGLGIICK